MPIWPDTQRTENLLSSLKEIATEGKFLFGHHNDANYCVGWFREEGRSDVESVCGDYPALLGMDLDRLEMDEVQVEHFRVDSAGSESTRSQILAECRSIQLTDGESLVIVQTDGSAGCLRNM